MRNEVEHFENPVQRLVKPFSNQFVYPFLRQFRQRKNIFIRVQFLPSPVKQVEIIN